MATLEDDRRTEATSCPRCHKSRPAASIACAECSFEILPPLHAPAPAPAPALPPAPAPVLLLPPAPAPFRHSQPQSRTGPRCHGPVSPVRPTTPVPAWIAARHFISTPGSPPGSSRASAKQAAELESPNAVAGGGDRGRGDDENRAAVPDEASSDGEEKHSAPEVFHHFVFSGELEALPDCVTVNDMATEMTQLAADISGAADNDALVEQLKRELEGLRAKIDTLCVGDGIEIDAGKDETPYVASILAMHARSRTVKVRFLVVPEQFDDVQAREVFWSMRVSWEPLALVVKKVAVFAETPPGGLPPGAYLCRRAYNLVEKEIVSMGNMPSASSPTEPGEEEISIKADKRAVLPARIHATGEKLLPDSSELQAGRLYAAQQVVDGKPGHVSDSLAQYLLAAQRLTVYSARQLVWVKPEGVGPELSPSRGFMNGWAWGPVWGGTHSKAPQPARVAEKDNIVLVVNNRGLPVRVKRSRLQGRSNKIGALEALALAKGNTVAALQIVRGMEAQRPPGERWSSAEIHRALAGARKIMLRQRPSELGDEVDDEKDYGIPTKGFQDVIDFHIRFATKPRFSEPSGGGKKKDKARVAVAAAAPGDAVTTGVKRKA